MESDGSGGRKDSAGMKRPAVLLIILLALAVILAAWLFLGWMITKLVVGAVYLIFELLTAPFRSFSR
jgi:hypothetical protein